MYLDLNCFSYASAFSSISFLCYYIFKYFCYSSTFFRDIFFSCCFNNWQAYQSISFGIINNYFVILSISLAISFSSINSLSSSKFLFLVLLVLLIWFILTFSIFLIFLLLFFLFLDFLVLFLVFLDFLVFLFLLGLTFLYMLKKQLFK